MITRIPALKAATIYQASASLNTGADEIMELTKEGNRNGDRNLYQSYPTRILLEFPTDTLQQYAGEEGNNFNLRLFATDTSYIPDSASFVVFPVSESWNQGTGRRFNVPSTSNGVNWKSTDGKNLWFVSESSGEFFADFSTASCATNEKGGGNWYFIESSSFQLFTTSSDVDADITDIADKWVSGTFYPNHGLILKFSGSTETDLVHYGNFQFFGPLTNTIYKPVIEIRREDWTFSGSLQEAEYDCRVEMVPRFEGYGTSETARLQLVVKDTYTLPSFTAGTNLRVLPSSSWYEIIDTYSEAVIIRGDQTFTRLSRNTRGNYFDLPLVGFSPNRRYQVKVYADFDGAQKEFVGMHFKVKD